MVTFRNRLPLNVSSDICNCFSSHQAKGDRENPAPTSCIGVFGLNFKTTDADLHRAFSKFGSIEKVNVVLDGPSKRSRGFAFLYFETVAMAKKAKEVIGLLGLNVR